MSGHAYLGLEPGETANEIELRFELCELTRMQTQEHCNKKLTAPQGYMRT